MIKTKRKSLCNGCGACYSSCPKNCIIMKEDEEGFLYPFIDNEKCVDCRLCEKICPVLKNKSVVSNPVAYAVFNNDLKIRENSSSGGVFSLIAENIINKNGVVFGARYNASENNVVHTYVETIEELAKLRGSKYFQSRLENSFVSAKEFLEADRYVLFSGTPCQISGLKAFLNKEYDKLYTQDIICHGVPSKMVWQKYVDFCCDGNQKKIEEVFFRNKDNGWNNYNLKISFTNGEIKKECFKNNLFMKSFLSNVCLRPSCYACVNKTINRQSDFTLADYWGVKNVHPQFNDDKGVSLCVLHTKKGMGLFEEISQKTTFLKTDLDSAIKHNSSMIKSVALPKKRKFFFENINKLSFDVLVKKSCNVSLFQKSLRFCKRVVKKLIKK